MKKSFLIRAFCMIMVMITVLVILPVNAVATLTPSTSGNGGIIVDWEELFGPTPSAGLSYTLKSNNTYELSSKGSCTDTRIVIPEFYKEKAVTSIAASVFQYNDEITEVIFPKTLTTIGTSAFMNCTALTTLTFANGLTTIGAKAFSGCTALATVTLPKTVSSIDATAFMSCTGLRELTVDYANPIYSSQDNCVIEIATNKLVLGCKTSVIPETVTVIGNSAFYGCTGLTEITIPDAVTTIEASAFRGCTALETINIGIGLTTVGNTAFAAATAVTDVYYSGRASQWAKITFGNGNTTLTDATIHCAVKLGDLNDDGTINLADLTLLTRHLADWTDYAEINEDAADINEDGQVSLADLTYLTRALAGWEGYEL